MIFFKRIIAAAILLHSLAVSSVASVAKPDKIILGVVPEVNLIKQVERFIPLAAYLGKKTGFEIEIKPLSSYGQLYDELRTGRIDGGFFGSFVYCITRARLGIIPLARPVQPGGKSTYTGILFVRKDAEIKNAGDMKGKTIALADPATAAGYLAQKEFFFEHGINMDKELKILWTGSHDAAIHAVLSNQAEIGGAKDTVVAKYRKQNRVFDASAEIINENPKKGVPDNTFAVRKEMESATIDLLKKTLLTMNSNPEGKKVLERFGAIKFIPTSDDDFKPLYELVKKLKIDLVSYPYKKDMPIPLSRK